MTSRTVAGEGYPSPFLVFLAEQLLPEATPEIPEDPAGLEDQDGEDVDMGVNEDALEADDMDTDRITSGD